MSVRSATMERNQPFKPAVAARLRAAIGPLPAFGRDFGIVVAVLIVYFILRGQAPGRDAFAVAFTLRLVDFEKSLHIFWEPAIQAWSIRVHLVQEIANGIYAYGHFPTLAVVAGWLWFRGREKFAFMRNTMFISMVIGLVFYYTLPAAPPRLMAEYGYNFGFVDTVFGGHTSVSYAQPSIILNNYAAVPSFHFGWIALASAAVWVNTRNIWARGAAVLMSLVMAWAIVASANHLFVDMALGLLVVAFSWYLARRLERWQLARKTTAIALIEAPDSEQAA